MAIPLLFSSRFIELNLYPMRVFRIMGPT